MNRNNHRAAARQAMAWLLACAALSACQRSGPATPAGGEVTVSLHALLGSAVLRVSDTGKGISAADQAELFTRFGSTTSSTAARVRRA